MPAHGILDRVKQQCSTKSNAAAKNDDGWVEHMQEFSRGLPDELARAYEGFFRQRIALLGHYSLNIAKGTWESSDTLDDITAPSRHLEPS